MHTDQPAVPETHHPEPKPSLRQLGAGLLSRLGWVEKLPAVIRLAALGNDLTFRFWQLAHRGGSFADYYVWRISRKLDRNRPHKTLGRRVFRPGGAVACGALHDRDSFARTGLRPFHWVAHVAGLTEGDVVADFGCGSLRLGQHFMQRVAPGSYWGLDVSDRFFREGLDVLGPDEVARFRPNLRVISEASLAEARAASPSLVVAVAVLKHVPQSEWDRFFDGLMNLVTERTRLVLTFDAAEKPERILGKSWAYPIEMVEREIERRRPDARFVTETPPKKGPGRRRTRRATLLMARWEAPATDIAAAWKSRPSPA
jgi:hypothetical protein